MVRHGIQKAREKLIDLSLRNGMLNYRHSESSSRHVRVVHQLPSAVVECLASEKSIDLVPLHPVETTPRDEDTDVFRAALREAADPEWLAAEDAKRAAGSRRRSKDKAAERSLRDHEALTELLSYRPTPRQALDNSDIGGPWLYLTRNTLNSQ